MGGSILPVTIIKNQLYFLFGKERDIDSHPGWSDFGGGTDKGESFMQTAIREGGEELTGFLGQIKPLLKRGTYNIDFKSKGHDVYRCHLFHLEYDKWLPYYYNNNQQFLQKHLDPKIIADTKIFEKTEIRWFSVKELKTKRGEFRSFYQNIIDMILMQIDGINRFIKKKNRLKSQKNKKSRKTRQTKVKR